VSKHNRERTQNNTIRPYHSWAGEKIKGNPIENGWKKKRKTKDKTNKQTNKQLQQLQPITYNLQPTTITIQTTIKTTTTTVITTTTTITTNIIITI